MEGLGRLVRCHDASVIHVSCSYSDEFDIEEERSVIRAKAEAFLWSLVLGQWVYEDWRQKFEREREIL
jgi:hypothetical protein